jgi:hypothetical protein
MNELSRYIEKMLKSRFPQSYLLSSNDFIRFTKSIDLDLDIQDLEFFDKVGIIKPALRLRRRKVSGNFPKYEIVSSDIFSFQGYYENGQIELVRDEYQVWETYKDGMENKTILYYHPFQFLPLRRLTMGLVPRLKAANLEKIKNIQELFESIKNFARDGLATSKKSYEEFWIPRIGLLILLDEAYVPLVKPFKVNIYSNSRSYFNEWNDWRLNEFIPQHILKNSNLSIEQIKGWYEGVATEGEWMDPLSKWFVLQRIIKESMKMRLKGPALFAQHCYKLARMLSYFVYDLTGEKLYDPDDIMDGNGHGQWKSRVYGDPFDYTSKKTQKRILDTFLIDRPFRVGIIFEGDAEQVVIEAIIKALRIDKERDGFFLYNAKGQKNIIRNLKSLYDISTKEDIELFLILDNDEDASRIKDQLKNFVNIENITIWKRDFEYDNFGLNNVINNMNDILKSKGYKPISQKVTSNLLNTSNKVLMNIISGIVYKENGVKLKDILSKRELAERLIRERSMEIEKERFEGDGWNPKLPIENVLNEIFHKFPAISFS